MNQTQSPTSSPTTEERVSGKTKGIWKKDGYEGDPPPLTFRTIQTFTAEAPPDDDLTVSVLNPSRYSVYTREEMTRIEAGIEADWKRYYDIALSPSAPALQAIRHIAQEMARIKASAVRIVREKEVLLEGDLDRDKPYKASAKGGRRLPPLSPDANESD